MLISQLYKKGAQVIDENKTIAEATELLVEKRMNGLIVVNKQKEVTGVLAVQDIAAATVPSQFRDNIQMAAAMYRPGFFSENCDQIKDKAVKEIMRKNFVIVGLNDNIMAVTADFLKNDLYIVPVIDEGKLIGVITRSEIKKALAYGMRLPGYISKYKDAADEPDN